jgi:hypothetical protein
MFHVCVLTDSSKNYIVSGGANREEVLRNNPKITSLKGDVSIVYCTTFMMDDEGNRLVQKLRNYSQNELRSLVKINNPQLSDLSKQIP